MNKKHMKILFDAGPLVNGNRTGVGRATEGLVLALANTYPDTELVGHYFDFLRRKKPHNLPTAPNIRYRTTTFVPGKVFNMLRRLGLWVPFELLVKERGDFHLFPSFVGWPSLFKTPSAPFVHDITYIDYPQYVSDVARLDLQTLVPRTIQRSSFIITNSESSKKGILREYPTTKQPIIVEHLPTVGTVSISKKEAAAYLQKLGVTGKYLLFFGTLEPRKNLIGLIGAYRRLKPSIREQYALVIAGGKGWKDDEILRSLNQLKRSGAVVIQTGYVSDEERAALYIGAAVYVMPSHYEGFGMQLLEGMTYGVPMLVSDIPVLREVAKDAAAYCGTDPLSIANGLESLLSNPDRRKMLTHAGKTRLQSFSWARVAHDVYTHMAGPVK